MLDCGKRRSPPSRMLGFALYSTWPWSRGLAKALRGTSGSDSTVQCQPRSLWTTWSWELLKTRQSWYIPMSRSSQSQTATSTGTSLGLGSIRQKRQLIKEKAEERLLKRCIKLLGWLIVKIFPDWKIFTVTQFQNWRNNQWIAVDKSDVKGICCTKQPHTAASYDAFDHCLRQDRQDLLRRWWELQHKRDAAVMIAHPQPVGLFLVDGPREWGQCNATPESWLALSQGHGQVGGIPTGHHHEGLQKVPANAIIQAEGSWIKHD